METQKTSNSQSTKLQSSRKYGTRTRRNIDERNKIESPEINPCTYGHLYLIKQAKIYSGEKNLFNKWFWKTGQSLVKE